MTNSFFSMETFRLPPLASTALLILRLLVLADINGTLLNFELLIATCGIGALTLSIARVAYLFIFSENNPNRRAEGWVLLFVAALGLTLLVLAPDLAIAIHNAINTTPQAPVSTNNGGTPFTTNP
ncbi:MAG TPA: hypothetical protein VFN02_05900 [Ktedonobacteraceae bacterium]|nr:hypothetical protein [Ktedonobacteraceae bacterium]